MSLVPEKPRKLRGRNTALNFSTFRPGLVGTHNDRDSQAVINLLQQPENNRHPSGTHTRPHAPFPFFLLTSRVLRLAFYQARVSMATRDTSSSDQSTHIPRSKT